MSTTVEMTLGILNQLEHTHRRPYGLIRASYTALTFHNDVS